MRFIEVAGLVQRGVFNASRLFVDGHNHAAAVEIIDKLAVSDAEIRGNYMHNAVLEQGNDTAGIDRMRMQGHQFGMLYGDLFQQGEAMLV